MSLCLYTSMMKFQTWSLNNYHWVYYTRDIIVFTHQLDENSDWSLINLSLSILYNRYIFILTHQCQWKFRLDFSFWSSLKQVSRYFKYLCKAGQATLYILRYTLSFNIVIKDWLRTWPKFSSYNMLFCLVTFISKLRLHLQYTQNFNSTNKLTFFQSAKQPTNTKTGHFVNEQLNLDYSSWMVWNLIKCTCVTLQYSYTLGFLVSLMRNYSLFK